jgi:hypothetical protein
MTCCSCNLRVVNLPFKKKKKRVVDLRKSVVGVVVV